MWFPSRCWSPPLDGQILFMEHEKGSVEFYYKILLDSPEVFTAQFLDYAMEYSPLNAEMFIAMERRLCELKFTTNG